jgi:hypothetical protein
VKEIYTRQQNGAKPDVPRIIQAEKPPGTVYESTNQSSDKFPGAISSEILYSMEIGV